MTDNPLTHETIEQAYKPAGEIISRLPDSVESREARRNLDIAERLTHVAREKAPREDVTATMATRGPALTGWPWTAIAPEGPGS